MSFDGSIDGTISPGKKLTGYYAVEVPKSTKELTLEVKSSWLSWNEAKFLFTIPKD
jgi:Telomeric repeat-binding factor 2.